MNSIFYTGLKPPHISINGLIHLPTIKIMHCLPHNKKNILNYLENIPYVVFFSKNGVNGLCNFYKKTPNVVFAVGKKTAERIWDVWNIKTIQPLQSNAQGMCELFAQITPYPTLVVQGDKGRSEFTSWLRQNNWDFQMACVYQTQVIANEKINNSFKNIPDEIIIFTSPTTVEGFLKSICTENLAKINAKIISLGSTTSKAILNLQGKIFFQPEIPDLNIIASFIKEM